MERKRLREEAYRLKLLHRGPQVYFRGLIEISNICRKNCLYCGIRSGNHCVQRYEMSDEQVLQEAQFALDAGYGSIAIQGGERSDSHFIERITRLLYNIRRLVPGGGGKPASAAGLQSYGIVDSSEAAEASVVAGSLWQGVSAPPANSLGITLSLGEQPIEVYREWKKAGASRYLLRIEASNRELYEKIHPGPGAFDPAASAGPTVAGAGPAAAIAAPAAATPAAVATAAPAGAVAAGPSAATSAAAALHSYDTRLRALLDLKTSGYLLGTGVMIGLPFQRYSHLEEDLQFFKELDVDMVGMGPFIPHKDTPLGNLSGVKEGDFLNMSNRELLDLCIDMVARLRILMPDINIAATTALQVLNPFGREEALLAGANVIMPNMTETALRGSYSLYEGKQGVEDDALSTRTKLLENLERLGVPVGWGFRGDRRQVTE